MVPKHDKTDEALKPYQPYGIPMLYFFFGISAIILAITGIYEVFF